MSPYVSGKAPDDPDEWVECTGDCKNCPADECADLDPYDWSIGAFVNIAEARASFAKRDAELGGT